MQTLPQIGRDLVQVLVRLFAASRILVAIRGSRLLDACRLRADALEVRVKYVVLVGQALAPIKDALSTTTTHALEIIVRTYP